MTTHVRFPVHMSLPTFRKEAKNENSIVACPESIVACPESVPTNL